MFIMQAAAETDEVVIAVTKDLACAYLANLETDKVLAPCIPSGRLQHYWYITGTMVLSGLKGY